MIGPAVPSGFRVAIALRVQLPFVNRLKPIVSVLFVRAHCGSGTNMNLSP